MVFRALSLMVVTVKILRTKGFKGRCEGCNVSLRNGQLVVNDSAMKRRRYRHVGCKWPRSVSWKIVRGAGAALEDIPAEEYATVKARVDEAVQRERAAAREERRTELRKQIEHREQRLRAYPIGQKLVYTVRDGRTLFVRVTSFSRLGHSVRVCAVGKKVVDTWVQTWPHCSYRDAYAETMRKTITLYRATWDQDTDICFTVSSNQLGLTLVKGADCSRPVEFTPLAVPEVEQANPPDGASVVNVRSTGGRLWVSLELEVEFTVPMLRDTVASTIGLLPTMKPARKAPCPVPTGKVVGAGWSLATAWSEIEEIRA